MKVECHTCGHFSLIKVDGGWVKGCSALSEIMAEEAKTGEIAVDGEVFGELHYIDTKFMLNKNDDCIAWIEQNEKQKQALKTIKDYRKKNLWRHILWKLRGGNAGSE